MLKNGKTFQVACITFLCKICYGVFAYDTVASLTNNADEIKQVLKQMGNMQQLIKANILYERELFSKIFSIIGEEVLGYCYSNALEVAESSQSSLDASNYLKLDTTYYKDIIKRLWSRYNKNNELKECVHAICGIN